MLSDISLWFWFAFSHWLVILSIFSCACWFSVCRLEKCLSVQVPLFKLSCLFFFMLSFMQCRRPGFYPWIGKIPWRREWLPTPVFLPGEFHGQRSLAEYRSWGHKELEMTDWLTLFILFYDLFVCFEYQLLIRCIVNFLFYSVGCLFCCVDSFLCCAKASSFDVVPFFDFCFVSFA